MDRKNTTYNGSDGKEYADLKSLIQGNKEYKERIFTKKNLVKKLITPLVLVGALTGCNLENDTGQYFYAEKGFDSVDRYTVIVNPEYDIIEERF